LLEESKERALQLRRRAMTGMCAKETAGVDVLRTQRTTALSASIGRRARLEDSPREGPQCALKPSFPSEREIRFDAGRSLRYLAAAGLVACGSSF
jgi:hypothetical protein